MKSPFLFFLVFFIPVISGNTIVDELGTPSREGTDYALFFSVTDFDDWPDFPASSAQEVRAIEQELKMEYGFQTEFIANPSKQRILSVLGQYAKRRYQPQDQLLIYFSMHGQYDKAMGAIIPKDGKENDFSYESWITHPTLEALISRIPCQHIILSLDACYSGTFGEKYRGRPDAPAWEVGEDCESRTANALKYKSRLYLTSGGAERTPTQSQFAKKWLEALRGRNVDGLLGFHELYDVLKEANPRPRFGDFRGHIPSGDFVFIHKDACQSVSVADDATHWQQLGRNSSRTVVLRHLELFPNCPHQTSAFALLSGNAPFSTESAKKASALPLPPNDMVFVQGGTFEMGNTFGDGDGDEKPTHKVTVSNFYLGRFELTFAEYDAFCVATQRKKPDDEGWGRGKRPVINVSWNDAVAYCNWRSEQESLELVYVIKGDEVTPNWSANGYRLPTEAEWEYAARSRGEKEKWAGTDEVSKLASYGNYYENGKKWKDGFEYTSGVGSFKANDLGLYDMSGNVWDWCWDWYDAYTATVQIKPQGPASGSRRVLRGGSWRDVPAYLRCAFRSSGTPAGRSYSIGFRLCRAAP